MSFIEGIGDDLLYAFGFLLFIGIISLAWLSTHVNHFHFPNTLFIIERRTRRRNEEEPERTSPIPSPILNSPSEEQQQQTRTPSSGNDTQTELDSDNESSETEEFIPEQTPPLHQHPILCSQCSNSNPITTESVQTSSTDHHPSSTTGPEVGSLRIVIKFLNDTQKPILANPNDTISTIKRLYFADELASNKLVRFIYQGRELRDPETLHGCNIRDQTTIHCQITTRHRPSSSSVRSDDGSSTINGSTNGFDTSSLIDASPINISSHFVLLLSLVLGLVWYLRIKYRTLFSPISTVVLILITLIFFVFTCAPLLTARRQSTHASSSRQTATTMEIQHIHVD